MKKLLIVESPAKAHTIGAYLGNEFLVKSSVGHVRDLPKEGGAIKITEVDKGHWTFTPTYIISDGKQKVVEDLKAAVKKTSEIYLASDPDREGEAIAWHLQSVLADVAGDKPFHRVTYNEITKKAVLKAVNEPRAIDMPLVDAQQARRILDRIVGYKVSPLLWKNVSCAKNRTLSAGRVQSVALRLLVERQREIDAFVPEKYYLMGVEARKQNDEKSFVARLSRMDDKKVDIRSKEQADRALLDLSDAELVVKDMKDQPKSRHALPPFTTSTLQQAASSVLGFSPGKTMKLAQSLYEAGRITYMRTDSVNVSDQARAAAKDFVVKYCGPEFYPEKPNFFADKAKAGVEAQGAHEAIRPTDVELSPKRAAEKGMDATELKLYDLIWRRFIASQMADAKTTVKTILIEACKPGLAHDYLFSASATIVDFEGFLKIMKLSLKKKTKDGEDDEDSDEVAYLPDVKIGEKLDVLRWISDEKSTKGPTHYSEASLIKTLEENGVGRPSTYAATIETLKTREYAKTEKKKLIPLERGILVCDWLVKNMDSFFSVGFTAAMEAKLDKVASGVEPLNEMLSDFYGEFLGGLPRPVPPPSNEKFEFVFELLGEIKEWKPSKKVGRRIYDDKAFVQSVKDQMASGERPLSARQLEFLVRMAIGYADQIPDVEARLKAAGIGAGVTLVERADNELVTYCLDLMKRLPSVENNVFFKSLRDQFEHGRGLTLKQFGYLAKAIGDNAVSFDNAAEIREKLLPFVPGGFTERKSDPYLPMLFKVADLIKKWRPLEKDSTQKFDDQSFVASLRKQFEARNSLSHRQVLALKRILFSYKAEIPDYDARAKELDLPTENVRRRK